MRLILTLLALAMFTIAVGCAPKEADTTAAASSSTSGTQTAATTPDTGNMQLVSLKLPGMT